MNSRLDKYFELFVTFLSSFPCKAVTQLCNIHGTSNAGNHWHYAMLNTSPSRSRRRWMATSASTRCRIRCTASRSRRASNSRWWSSASPVSGSRRSWTRYSTPASIRERTTSRLPARLSRRSTCNPCQPVNKSKRSFIPDIEENGVSLKLTIIDTPGKPTTDQ